MYEFKKALWMLALSTPILFASNHMAGRLYADFDASLFEVTSQDVPTQAQRIQVVNYHH